MTLKNSELPNSENFSNLDWDWGKVGDIDIVKDLGTKKSKNEIDAIQKAPISQKKILGMHPMTMIITSVGLIVLSITGIIIYRKIN